MAITKEERWAKVFAESIRQFNNVQSTIRNERIQCLEDRRFYSIPGAQWEGNLGIQFENKPKLEINKVHLAVMRIISEYRNNQIDVTFMAKDGSDDNGLADTCAGLFRADEQDSEAQEAYDNAFEEAVGGGFGAYRLRVASDDDEDDDEGDLRIRIEPIYDADTSVFFDLGAKRQDKADAKHCWVLTAMTRDDYKEQYGDDIESLQKIITKTYFDWLTPDVIYVAEYYKVEWIKEVVQTWRNVAGEEYTLDQDDIEADPELEQREKAVGSVMVKEEKKKRKHIHKYIMNGAQILSDEGIIAGSCIPVVPVYGKRWFVDNVERCMGVVRLTKDPQRLYNMQVSKTAEVAALSTVEKPIFAPEQIAGFGKMWEEDNIKNYPYLMAKPIMAPDGTVQQVGPIAYTKSPQLAPALMASIQLSGADIQELLGNQNQADKIVSNIGEKTAMLAQTRVDMASYIYMSNFAKAKKRGAEIWLGMARDTYAEEGRSLKAIDATGNASPITIGEPGMVKGVQTYKNDLSEADFDVNVDVGPASSSKKDAMVKTLTELLQFTQNDPQTQQMLLSMIIMNYQSEGMGDLQEYERKKLVAMGVLPPNDEERQQMQQPKQPDAQTLAMQAAANDYNAAATLKHVNTLKALQDIKKSQADQAHTEAQALQIVHDMSVEDRNFVLSILQQQSSSQPTPQQPGVMPQQMNQGGFPDAQSSGGQ